MADPNSRAGLRYASPQVLEYLTSLHAPHHHALELAYTAPEREGLPAIQVGPLEGRLIALLMKLAGARRVVEVGTLAGYSALFMADALPPDARIISLEKEPEHARVAREAIAAAGLADRIDVRVGTALELLPAVSEEGPFDAVFIDADKGNYDRYGRWARDNTRPGGLLLGDNAFFFGKLLEDTEDAAAMRRFHEEAREHYDTVCIPTPDGLLLGIRKPANTG